MPDPRLDTRSRELRRLVVRGLAGCERGHVGSQFAFHPTLHFMIKRINNKYHKIGREGIRYEPDWNDA
jgi:hypothetical protein